MNQEPLTLYKLIVLVHAGQGHISLTTARGSVNSSWIREYTNFLTLQTAISELMETGLAESRTILEQDTAADHRRRARYPTLF